jgi:DNA-binding SARP family transcriptional activator
VTWCENPVLAMEFRILGPMEVLDAGRVLTPRRAKQRTLLAVLLVRANKPVAGDVLVDALWGERPPATALTALHGHVSALRKLLVSAITGSSPVLITEIPQVGSA